MRLSKVFLVVSILFCSVCCFAQVVDPGNPDDPANSKLGIDIAIPVGEGVDPNNGNVIPQEPSASDDVPSALSEETKAENAERIKEAESKIVIQETAPIEALPNDQSVPAVPSRPTTAAVTGPRISQIQVTGNTNINTDAILGDISLRIGDPFDMNAVKSDVDAIYNMGFFTNVTYQKEDVPNGVVLTFEVSEYPKITEIVIETPEPLKTEDVLSALKTQVGNVLNTNTLRADYESISNLYLNQGYFASVSTAADVDMDTGRLYLPITVFKVGSITFEGNAKTKPYVLSREMTLKPGDYFNAKTLEQDLQTLFNLECFEDIKNPVPSLNDEDTVDIVISVTEKKTGQINFGIGYSARQKFVGQLKVSDSNFQGTGRKISFLWEQGTQSGYQGGGSWEFNFTEPWLLKNRTSGTISLYNKLVYRFNSGVWSSSALPNDVDYDERHKGGRVSFNRPLDKQTSLNLSFRYDDVTTNPALLQEDELWKIIQNGQVYGVGLSWINDTRDIYADPKKGSYKLAQLDLGRTDGSQYIPTLFPGSYVKTPLVGNFIKGTLEYKYFYTPGELKDKLAKDRRGTFAFRARVGITSGTVPFFEQCFVGGAETLRGYDDDRFWGNYMALANFEYRQPVLDYVSLVAFADYGDAWGADEVLSYGDLVQSQSFKGHLGIGIGARAVTPMGNIRLDWGFGDEGSKVHFSMGHTF